MPSCWEPIPGTRAGSTRCVFGLHPPWPFPRSEPSRECPHFGVGHGLHVFCADTRGARTCFGRRAAGGTVGSSRVCARSVLPGPRPRPGACARRCGRAHGRPRRPGSPCSSVGRPDLPCKPRGPGRVHFRFLSALPLPGDSLLPCDSSARVPAGPCPGQTRIVHECREGASDVRSPVPLPVLGGRSLCDGRGSTLPNRSVLGCKFPSDVISLICTCNLSVVLRIFQLS